MKRLDQGRVYYPIQKLFSFKMKSKWTSWCKIAFRIKRQLICKEHKLNSQKSSVTLRSTMGLIPLSLCSAKISSSRQSLKISLKGSVFDAKRKKTRASLYYWRYTSICSPGLMQNGRFTCIYLKHLVFYTLIWHAPSAVVETKTWWAWNFWELNSAMSAN